MSYLCLLTWKWFCPAHLSKKSDLLASVLPCAALPPHGLLREQDDDDEKLTQCEEGRLLASEDMGAGHHAFMLSIPDDGSPKSSVTRGPRLLQPPNFQETQEAPHQG